MYKQCTSSWHRQLAISSAHSSCLHVTHLPGLGSLLLENVRHKVHTSGVYVGETHLASTSPISLAAASLASALSLSAFFS